MSDVRDEIVERLQALIEKTREVSKRLREATARRRKLSDKIEGLLITPGARAYKSRWECSDFGFFSGSNVAEPVRQPQQKPSIRSVKATTS